LYGATVVFFLHPAGATKSAIATNPATTRAPDSAPTLLSRSTRSLRARGRLARAQDVYVGRSSLVPRSWNVASSGLDLESVYFLFNFFSHQA
jgi:hypothetical protein